MDALKINGFLHHTLLNSKSFTPYEIKLNNGIYLIHRDIGILEVIPTRYKKSIILSSGIHGNETAPLEFIDEIVKNIINEKIILNVRILFIIAHPDAINQNKRYIDENLNRCFNGKNKSNTCENIISNKLQKQISDFYLNDKESEKRWHFDLHCAIRGSLHSIFSIIPITTIQINIRPMLSFLQKAKIEATLLNNQSSSTLSWWTAQHFGALSATIEMGQVKPLYQNDMARFSQLKNAICNMISAKSISIEAKEADLTMILYKVSSVIVKKEPSFHFTFPNHTVNFTYFASNTLLAKEINMQYFAKEEGEAVVFPNADVAIGQRACLLVQPFIATKKEPLFAQLI